MIGLKSILSNVGMKLDRQRAKNKQMAEDLIRLQDRCEKMRNTNAEIRAKHLDITNRTLSVAERVKKMEEMVEVSNI